MALSRRFLQLLHIDLSRVLADQERRPDQNLRENSRLVSVLWD